jgi:hypothetical protein
VSRLLSGRLCPARYCPPLASLSSSAAGTRSTVTSVPATQCVVV